MKYSGLFAFLLLICTSVSAQISIHPQEEGLLVLEKQDSVLFYQTAQKSLQGDYERTHYIHPLWNVDGVLLSEDFPADHLHQRGVFWAWHQIRADGEQLGDGWELEHFIQEVKKTEYKTGQDGTGIIEAEVYWKSDLRTLNGEPDPYLRENMTMTIHPQKKNYRQIDFEIVLVPLTESVSIGGSEDDKGYSGFSVRMKLPEDVQFTGPAGEVEIQNLAVESPGYVNVSGTFDEKFPGGVLILDHPDNPGYPQTWILRKARSMQNVKFPGREPVTLDSQNPLTLKYSVVTYQGKLKKKDLKKILKNRE